MGVYLSLIHTNLLLGPSPNTPITMVKKVMKKPAGEKKMARKGKKTFNSYIFKVLKQVHPKTGMSKKSMNIVNSIVADTFDKIATEAGKLCRISKRHTLSSKEVQSAIRLVLPGELSKHAVSEGTKAMTKFTSA